jgi:hypothetical protein
MATVVVVPKEVKEQEGRVWMQPDGVAELGGPRCASYLPRAGPRLEQE